MNKSKPFIHCWWEYKIAQLLWKSLAVPQMLNIVAYDPGIPYLGIYPRELKTDVHTKTYP